MKYKVGDFFEYKYDKNKYKIIGKIISVSKLNDSIGYICVYNNENSGYIGDKVGSKYWFNFKSRMDNRSKIVKFEDIFIDLI